jgi:hypothetical protein
MNPFRFLRRDGSISAVGRTVGAVAILLVGLLAYLSADPAAHERFHHDADKADHHCVITEFAAGEALYLAPTIEVRPTLAVLWESAAAAPPEIFRPPVDYILRPICGPPAAGPNA